MYTKIGQHDFVSVGGIVNRAAWEKSCQVDAVRDRDWFTARPGVTERVRPPTLNELMAINRGIGEVEVHVKRQPDGAQYRAFVELKDAARPDSN